MTRPTEKIRLFRTKIIPRNAFDGSLISAMSYIESLIDDGWQNIEFYDSLIHASSSGFTLSKYTEETDEEFSERLRDWDEMQSVMKGKMEKLLQELSPKETEVLKDMLAYRNNTKSS